MNSHRTRPLRRLLLVSSLLLALSPVMAMAQTDKERELEARVAQLERLVEELMAQQNVLSNDQNATRQQQQAQAERLDRLPTTPEGVQPVQASTITPGSTPRSHFSYGGFIKLDAMLTDTSDGAIADGTPGRLFYLPQTIPVGGTNAEDPVLDVHGQFSRFWLAAETQLDSGDRLRGYLEFDLFGSALGNEAATNTYGLSVRHAFATWRGWLAGQTWTNFQDVAALPDAVDFIGPTEGTVFARQAQLRYSHGAWSFSLENPETLLTPHQGNGARIVSGDNLLPDVTARYTRRGEWGHFGVAGLLRQLKHHDPVAGIDDTALGYGLSLSGKVNLGERNDLRYMLTGGRGIGRYIGLAATNDVALDVQHEFDPIGALTGFVAWRHVFSPSLRTNVFYSRAEYDNNAAYTGLGITRRIHGLHANAIWTVLPKLEIGTELIWAQRELESGAEGELKRLHLHAKYSF